MLNRQFAPRNEGRLTRAGSPILSSYLLNVLVYALAQVLYSHILIPSSSQRHANTPPPSSLNRIPKDTFDEETMEQPEFPDVESQFEFWTLVRAARMEEQFQAHSDRTGEQAS